MVVKIPIKDDVLKAYLVGLFQFNNGAYIASATTLTGTAICALSQTSLHPQIFSDTETPELVLFKLPSNNCNDTFRNKFINLTPSSINKINGCLKREFETNFILFVVRCRMLGMQLKDAVELFIVENKMDTYFQGSIDTLSKRYYRFEVKNIDTMRKKLIKLAYYKLFNSVSSEIKSKNYLINKKKFR